MEELASVINNFARLILYAGGGVFTIAVCVAGFFYMTAFGDPQKQNIAPRRPRRRVRWRLHHGRQLLGPEDYAASSSLNRLVWRALRIPAIPVVTGRFGQL